VDYGEGLAGDLFVHLFLESILIRAQTRSRKGAVGRGGLFRWKDGRKFPDLIDTFILSNFRVAVRCNLNNEGGEFIGFYGTQAHGIKDSTRPTRHRIPGHNRKVTDLGLAQPPAEEYAISTQVSAADTSSIRS